jgi:hypothetical protein
MTDDHTTGNATHVCPHDDTEGDSPNTPPSDGKEPGTTSGTEDYGATERVRGDHHSHDDDSSPIL